MKDLFFWFLNRILYILMGGIVLFHDNFNEFQKCALILILGVLISLDNIKDAIKSNSTTSK